MDFDEQIDHIMNFFDFCKVHRVMTLLDWRWIRAPNGADVPSICDLKQTAMGLLATISIDDGEPHRLATGGFEAAKSKEGILSLCFIVEEADTCDIFSNV